MIHKKRKNNGTLFFKKKQKKQKKQTLNLMAYPIYDSAFLALLIFQFSHRPSAPYFFYD